MREMEQHGQPRKNGPKSMGGTHWGAINPYTWSHDAYKWPKIHGCVSRVFVHPFKSSYFTLLKQLVFGPALLYDDFLGSVISRELRGEECVKTTLP